MSPSIIQTKTSTMAVISGGVIIFLLVEVVARLLGVR